jgi:23S rRNA (uracil1939-C5)-methyltransferase
MPRKRPRKLLTQELFTTTIENLSHDGRGVAHIGGKTVFISGGLPGETLQFQYSSQRGSFDEGRAVNVIEPASGRQDPPCPHFGTCGGCSLQHIQLSMQLQHKQQAFQELLWRQARIAPQQWLPPIQSPAWGYRRKARLGVKFVAKKGRVLVGFRERQGRLITDSSQCHVLTPAIGAHLQEFSALIQSFSIRDKIPQLEIAVADNANAVVVRHLDAFSADDLTALATFARQYDLRIYLQPSGTDSVQLFYPSPAEELYYQLPRYHLKLEFQPLQFIQINPAVNQQMIDRTLELLNCQADDRILDLFCGIGNFSLPMARVGAQVIGVEGDTGAVQQARHNAQLNNLERCQFHCADLFQQNFSQEWAKQKFDKLLLDPPRSGAESVIESIHQWQPRRIVYVSCDLATLARDSVRLTAQGYQLSKAGIMDMFPHTQHAEAIALFEAV